MRKIWALVLWTGILFCWQPLWGQTTSVGIKTSGKEKQQSKLAGSQPAADQRGTQNVPLIVDIEGHKKSAGEAAEAKRKNDENEYRNRWTFRLTILTTLFTGALILVGIGGVLAALRTLVAIENQVAVLISSERAWVLVEIGELPPFKPDPNALEILWIHPTIKNFGKTPARITRVRGIVKLIPEGGQLPAVPEYVLGQGFDEQVDLVMPPNSPMQPRLAVTGQEFIEVQEQKKVLYVHGSVDYRDLGGKERSSAYCYAYVIQGGYSPAKSGFYPTLNAPAAYTTCT